MTHSKQTLIAALLMGTALGYPGFAAAQDTASSPTGASIAQTPTVAEDEVIAVGTFIPNEKKITSEITSVLDEEVFAQIGAGDIASALTRVTGLSLNRGKFVIVRGLNERYSSATLNGSPLPSPEPLRRVAPLDLFPTSVLADAVVQKTFSPEFSGEFGGGAISLRTKALPDERFLEVAVSGSANTETTLRDGLVYDGSDTDWLGFDDGLRDLPPLDENGIPTQNFENFSTLIIDTNNNIPFNGGFRLSAGDSYDLSGGQRIGVLATLGYDNSWETRRGQNNSTAVGANGELEIRNDLDLTSTENVIALNGLLTVGLEIDDNNSIEVVGLATRQSSAEARIIEGLNRDDDLFRQDFTEWFEREVYMGQLLGEHFIPSLNDAEVSWRASYAVAGRDAPYERRVNYVDDRDGRGYLFEANRQGSNNQLNFSELDDETFDLGLDLVFPTEIAGREVEFKIGGAYLDKARDTQEETYFYFGRVPDELLESRIDLIFSDALIESGDFDIRRAGTAGFPRVSDTGLTVTSTYAALEAEIIPNLRLSGGVRYEDSEQTTTIQDSIFGDQRFTFDPLTDEYFLPGATATYTFGDWQFRVAASKTINRPQFRELTPSIFVNTDTEDRFVGNPFLVNSESTNLDARLEYYFGANQFFTIGGFYKDLTNPIEEFVFNEADGQFTTSFINAPSAELFGLEVEFEKKFAIGEDIPFVSGLVGGQDFVVRSNYTYVDSSVSADGVVPIVTEQADFSQGITPNIINASGLYSDGRRLQGQSDHLANLQLGIENYDAGWDAFLLLNYSSDRIRAVESLPDRAPAIIEQLPISLDFVVNVPFELRGGEYEVGFKVQNILDDKYEASQALGGNEIIIDDYEIGTTFAASLKRRF